MVRLAALLMMVLVLSCEWQDTLISAMSGACCQTICCTSGDKDCSDAAKCPLMKNCMCCCYIVPEHFYFASLASADHRYDSHQPEDLTQRCSDCFHPPEMS